MSILLREKRVESSSCRQRNVMELMLMWIMVMSLSTQENKCDDADKCDWCGDDESDQTEASGRPEPGEREMVLGRQRRRSSG